MDAAGTAWLLCHGSTRGYGPGFFLYSSAAGWTASAGEWVAHGNILRGEDGVSAALCEDPAMWIDPGTGDFHALAHCYNTLSFNGTNSDSKYCAGHLYASNTTQTEPWNLHSGVNAPYGFAKSFSTRERPFLSIAADGSPRFLLNGVAPLSPVGDRSVRGKDWAWTLSQPILSEPCAGD